MLTSTTHSFIFMHVIKTGGTSIHYLLRSYSLQPSRNRMNRVLSDLGLRRDFRKTYFRFHDPITKAKSHMPADLFAQYYKFAFVRNSWDWLVSMYTFVSSTQNHRRYQKFRSMSFDDFLRREIRKEKHSQPGLLTDRKGNLLVDKIGRFEQLDSDFAQIA